MLNVYLIVLSYDIIQNLVLIQDKIYNVKWKHDNTVKESRIDKIHEVPTIFI